MLSIEQIKKKLQDRRLSVVSEKTGLSVNTLRGIRDGNTMDCLVSTLQALSDYFEGEDKK